jgi:glycine oxidase
VLSAPDVVFIGGGLIGLATAWRAATVGLSTVVVDPQPGRAASHAAAGMLAPVTEVRPGEEELLRLNLASAERYPSFVAELEEATGIDPGYWPCGTVAVARDGDDMAALDDLYVFQRELGLAAERLTRTGCRELEPALSPGVRGGYLVPGDHQIDNRALVRALMAACERAGVELRRGTVRAVQECRGAAPVVRLDTGDAVAAGTVVLCAGCWSAGIPGLVHEAAPPVRPVKGQLVHLVSRSAAPLLEHTVRGAELYVVPRRDGRVVVGATVEEQGFDRAATAGAVLALLRDAHELVPEIAELELVEIAVGLRPGSPDNAPIIGRTSMEGLVVATGHYRSGVLLTPVTADSVVELLVHGAVPEIIAPFSPERFARERVA